MKKVTRREIIFLILGFVIAGTVGAAAYTYNASQISYSPSDNTWNVHNVKAAIDDLKTNGTSEKICELKSGTALAIGSKYECNPSLDGTTKYDFYVLKQEGNSVKLIMERNISDTVGSARTMNWQNAMNFFRNGAGKNLGWKTEVELPRAQDIADAVGNTGWNISEKDYNGWFCLATKAKDYSSDPYCGDQSAQNYLYDYVRECANWGCQHSLDSSYAYGYWTSDMVVNSNNPARAWYIIRSGNLINYDISLSIYNGVRPVITISKNNIK